MISLSENLLPISQTSVNNQLISTCNMRDVHTALDVKKKFPDWIKNQIERGRFVEGVDYITQPIDSNASLSGEEIKTTTYGTSPKEYFGTLQMAEHIAMMSQTEAGFKVREYFRDMRDKAKGAAAAVPAFEMPALNASFFQQITNTMRDMEIQLIKKDLLLEYKDEKIKEVTQQKMVSDIKAITLADTVETLAKSKDTWLTKDVAKTFGWTAQYLNSLLMKEGMVDKKSDVDATKWPNRKYVDNGCFVTGLVTYDKQDGTKGTRIEAKITGAGLLYIIKIFQQRGYLQGNAQLDLGLLKAG